MPLLPVGIQFRTNERADIADIAYRVLGTNAIKGMRSRLDPRPGALQTLARCISNCKCTDKDAIATMLPSNERDIQ